MPTNQDREFYEQGVHDLREDGNAKIPVCLCLDVSGSMRGTPIDELNEGIRNFYETIDKDDVSRCMVDLCVVTFSNGAEIQQDFCSFDHQNIPQFDAYGLTHMGTGVNLALDCIRTRRKMYEETGVDYYRPWLIIMTDGKPEGEESEITASAIERITNSVTNKNTTVFAIGVGDNVDKSMLERFTPGRAPLKLVGLDFSKFFDWLSKSVGVISVSTPGEAISLPKVDFATGWDTVVT